MPPEEEYVPAAHSGQEADPATSWYLPEGQNEHASALATATFLKRPVGQLMHRSAERASLGLYEPGMHLQAHTTHRRWQKPRRRTG